MLPTDTTIPGEKNEHIYNGRNVKRFREILGLNHEGLTYVLGEDWSQRRVSLLEQKKILMIIYWSRYLKY